MAARIAQDMVAAPSRMLCGIGRWSRAVSQNTTMPTSSETPSVYLWEVASLNPPCGRSDPNGFPRHRPEHKQIATQQGRGDKNKTGRQDADVFNPSSLVLAGEFATPGQRSSTVGRLPSVRRSACCRHVARAY